jgi:hypothetical protein
MGDTGEKKTSRSIVNAMEDKHLRTPLRANEGKNIIVTLLRTGVIGLKDWLYGIGVPVGDPGCEYG